MASVSRKADASLPSSAEPSSESRRWKYDVCLSFRGADTRRGFTSHLYDGLKKRGITTFMDDPDLQVGAAIFPSLLTTIEESRLAIVVLSQNYAASTWCLEELTKICQLMEDGRLIILPVFYHVIPSDVRRQKGSFQDAFTNHERSGRYGSKKVQQWRDALTEVANISGWDSRNYRTESALVEEIVESVCSKVPQSAVKIEKAQLMEIDTGGSEETRQDMDELMEVRTDDEVSAVGVYGTGGLGKTSMIKPSGSFSSSAVKWKYDVFLCFMGPDTGWGFTSHLYHQLQDRGITTLMDDFEEDDISPLILTAIEESRLAIVVLSQNYAASTWCMDELTKICQLMEDGRLIILPVFYDVEPADVRKQRGSFEDAFTKYEKSGMYKSQWDVRHQQGSVQDPFFKPKAFFKYKMSGRYESGKVQQWRDALTKVANLAGWNSRDYRDDMELVNNIVEFVRSKVQPIEINTGDFEAFEATRQAMDEVFKALKDDEVTAVGVYGMGGVGKTTMVKHMCQQAQNNGLFDRVVMVVLSQSPDLRKIQGTLAEQLGFKLHENVEIDRAARLQKELRRSGKLLIILDDVWGRTELSIIGIPSYMELQKSNSKLLLTTRRLYVCHAMECQETIRLNVLSEEDSWALFVRNARRSFESATFEGLAKKIVRGCAGLPIALIAAARALGDKDMVEWKRAVQQLEKSQTANLEDMGEVSKCIKLSYDYLKNNDSKAFFLLCCLFPEGYDIPIEDLFRYAIGKGLFRDAETLEEARHEADSVARHLKDSSLLLDIEKKGFVRMHDVVRDTAIQIARSEDGHWIVNAGCGLQDWPHRLHEDCTAISLMENDIRKLPRELVCPKLQMLLLNYNSFIEEIPETFFKSSNEIRVLDLGRTDISLLPQSFGLLTNLRALYLDHCNRAVDISMAGKLKKLEILSMRDSHSIELSREIGDLTNLRVLDITGGNIARIPSNLISKLHNLEELYLDCGFCDWGSKVDGEQDETNACFDEVIGLPKLRVLEIRISDEECIPKLVEHNPNWVKFNIKIGYVEAMEGSNQYCNTAISLNLDTISNFPDWFFKAVIDKAESLEWKDCPRLVDIFMEYERGRLHGLKHLLVYGIDYEQMNKLTWVAKEPVFENLEELHLNHVDWQELCDGELLPGSLFNLKLLEVKSCYNLRNVLLPSRLIQTLPNLEELYCTSMEEIEYVFGYKALLEPKQSELRFLELCDLKTVRSMCDGPAPPAMFQTLHSLSIKECYLQGSLFTSDVAQCLFQLKYVILEECPLLERIVEESNKRIIFPKLEKLGLSKLPMLYYESATFDIECPSLEEVDVKDCPKFLVSVSDFHSRNQVQLHEDPFVDWYRTEKQLLGDIVESVSTHTVGSEEFQETRQGMDDLMEVQTDDEVSAIGVYGTGGVGKTTMVIPSGSSSSSAVNWKYDVYLSFRGADTRKGFTSTLCDGLKKRGITTFMDADLQVGDPISITLIKAIEESRFVIVVLSPNYATSTWCLEELTKICKFMEDGLRILPVFYAVNSSDVRYQKGSFEDAFTKHERSGRYGSEKVQQWREALRKVGSLSGWLAQDYKTEIELIEAIVEFVCSKIYTAGFEVFEATRRAMDEVMKALKDEEVAAIGVYGVGGVGKTTMVEHVCAKVWYEGMFHHVINVVVSKSPDLRKMQGTLADMLGLELEEETDIGRSHRLMQNIRRGSRILIILDDVWENIDLSSIGIPGYHELQRSNSKVLLITRTQNVLCAMECRSNICLDVLSEKDSLTLFMNRARMSFESINSYYAAKKVASVSAGLPIALIAVAKALGGKDNWEEAAQRLKASRHANPEDEDIVFNCIKLSYDYLAYDDARSCFLLCCLFPEDYDIQIEDLLKYGMGKGLFQDSSTMQDARASAHSVVKYLRDCSLLLESGQDGCVKMHDVIRDVAIRISSSEDGELFFVQAGCQLKKWPSISAPEGYIAISLIRNKICKLPEELVCSKLLILFMQSNVCLDEIPEDFFRGLNKLRVLDLSRTRISLLPMSFNLLINLHTLYLDGCLSIIDNISVLRELKGLKILSMRDLPLVELPKEIGYLKNLRMLDVTGEYVDIVPSEVIQSLGRLEELYMQCNFADWGSKGGRNEAYGSKVEGAGEQNMAAFDELTSLSNLNILKVFISDAKSLPTDVAGELNWVNFDICISRNSSIRKVSLVSNSSPLCTRALTVGTTINTLPVWFINVVTSKTEKLQYIMCWGLDNILVEYDCGRLHALKYLSVIGPSENLKVLMDTVTFVQNEPVFQNLEELHLVQVDCLKELCVGELPQGSLCNLRFLKVKHCYELAGALLPSQLLQRLQNLEKLICEEIDELEYVFGCEGLKPEHVILTQLKEMRLEKLEKLIKIWNGPAPCTIFQNLHSLVVSGCFELKTLFTADVAQSLLQLEDLSVECCPSLDRVIEASKETMDSKIVIPRLKNLALIKLPQLTRFYGNTGSAIECPQLKNLYEEKCPLFSASDFPRVQLINHQQHLDIVHKRGVDT